ncbi:MAG: hypothetical protein J07HQW1_02940 [Haloquadratum walsbyi J07HQW1]|uniref:Uncharacterized protein n=1 Tax=Haloquadratum walsbyi J07HQW1 TaxID=1238424 RepID=U1PL08_9EURY|nr:MAG: hypothetical protein J07HQW1_02940 [Haloquadratum walsbyi J07HQW1]
MTGDIGKKARAAFLALIMVTSVMTASVAFTGSAVAADTSTGFAAANPADADTSINDADHTYVLNLSATGTDFSDTLGDGTDTDTITSLIVMVVSLIGVALQHLKLSLGCMMPVGIRRQKYTSNNISSVTTDSSNYSSIWMPVPPSSTSLQTTDSELLLREMTNIY